jgi:hypothetical protein
MYSENTDVGMCYSANTQASLFPAPAELVYIHASDIDVATRLDLAHPPANLTPLFFTFFAMNVPV